MSSKKVITVFGASRPKEGSKAWNDALKLGEFLGKNDFILRNGGYSGTMESSSMGAKKEGGEIQGCICSPIFSSRPKGNPYLTDVIDHETLLMRIQKLTDSDISAYVILPGNIGTLTELCVIWCLKYIGVRDTPVFVFKDPFLKVVKTLREIDLINDDHIKMFTFVDSIDDCMEKILKLKL